MPPRGEKCSPSIWWLKRTAKTWGKQVEVVHLGDGSSEPVIFPTSRLEGSEVLASGENPLWTDRVRVETLANCQNRAIQVEYSGKTVLLIANGSHSDALAGTVLTGLGSYVRR